MNRIFSITRARINPERIAFLKFILEGYDGLAILSTVSRHDGAIQLSYYPACQEELFDLLNELDIDHDRSPVVFT